MIELKCWYRVMYIFQRPPLPLRLQRRPKKKHRPRPRRVCDAFCPIEACLISECTKEFDETHTFFACPVLICAEAAAAAEAKKKAEQEAKAKAAAGTSVLSCDLCMNEWSNSHVVVT